MSTSGKSYHHGDLRAALLTEAMRMVEAGEAFSLRAVAREAGVSPTAPYRHFTDRDALESALAAQGLRDLLSDLTEGRPPVVTPEDLTEIAVAYVDFALRRPELFRLMFTNACDEQNEERARAAGQIHELLGRAMLGVFPDADAEAMASAGWALAHGLACLYLDGKLLAASRADVAVHVRRAFAAILTARPSAVQPGSSSS
ncbi:MAG: TetR/AcrR family transcriptional regulator [Microbacterium sp.]|uniref:TetR/AcrR family transcriptional regulator n=1 Tax=Microbacterium sp. TaxID=51671 RepID=UPI0039E40D44